MKLWFHAGRFALHFCKLYINYPQINYYVCSCGKRTYKKDFTDTPIIIDQDWVRGEREEPRTPSHLKSEFVRTEAKKSERIKKQAEERANQPNSIDRMNKRLKEYKDLLDVYYKTGTVYSQERVKHYENYVIPELIKEHGQMNVNLHWQWIKQEPKVQWGEQIR